MKPWEKYAAEPAPAAGPWAKYGEQTPRVAEPEPAGDKRSTFNSAIRSTLPLLGPLGKLAAPLIEDPTEAIPMATTTGGIALGSTAGPLGMAAGGAAGAALGERIRGLITGAPEPTDEEKALAAGAGAIAGLGGWAVGKTVDVVWKAIGGAKVPTVKDLTLSARSLYKRAERAGVRINSGSWVGAISDINNAATKAGLHKALHPKVVAVLDDLQATQGRALTISEVDQMRRVLAGAKKSLEPDERRVASVVVEKLDDFMSGLKPSDVTAGSASPEAASKMISDARKLWTRVKKAERIGELVEVAKVNATGYSQSGLENALRAEFRRLARDIARNKVRGFSKAEEAAIKRVVAGSVPGNIMRWLGKFAPTGSLQGMGGTGMAGAAGFAAGGPVGAGLAAAGTAAGTAAARMGAQASTKGAAADALNLMLKGKPLAVGPGQMVAPLAGGAMHEPLRVDIHKKFPRLPQ